MSLYPSLEDMHVDKIQQAQQNVFNQIAQTVTAASAPPPPSGSLQGGGYPSMMMPTISVPNSNNDRQLLYPALGNFLGLELTEEVIRENMPEYLQNNIAISASNGIGIGNAVTNSNVIAPVTGDVAIPASAQVNHNIRELILCKDANGKVGLRVQEINKGIFVSIVVKNSPAALAGLRFGDQILQLNGKLVTGYSVEKFHKLIKSSDKNNISIVVRDRPFERTITLLKDSTGNLGFQFKNGKITAICRNSSAARNGVLTEHNLLEVNGQTVVAMKDKEITKIINEADRVVKITIVPTFIFDHMIKKLSTGFLRGIMDHSVPEF